MSITTLPNEPAIEMPSPIPGPKVLLVGGSGTGKTTCIQTFLEIAGIRKVACLFTEPGMEVLGHIPPDRLAWHYIRPATTDWNTRISQLKKINTLSYEALAKLSDMDKRKYTQFIDLYSCLADFKDQRTGKSLGPVDEWGTDRVLVMDSLSGINHMAMKLVVGGKPTKSQPDWGLAMDNVQDLITKLTTDVWCSVVMIAHQERETDEITGGTTNMVATLGRKLAPKIPLFFSDVIHVKREGDRFSWSTATMNTDLKSRNLGVRDNLPPSFVPLLKKWEAQGGLFSSTRPAVSGEEE